MTRRRVIFPDPDIWTHTHEQENSMIEVTAADFRRACALVVHHGRRNTNGLNAVLQEVNETERISELIFAVLDLYQQLIPVLHTEIGVSVLNQLIIDMACREEAETQ